MLKQGHGAVLRARVVYGRIEIPFVHLDRWLLSLWAHLDDLHLPSGGRIPNATACERGKSLVTVLRHVTSLALVRPPEHQPLRRLRTVVKVLCDNFE